jgi:putative ABC transport system substrate-binding protein
MTEVRGRKSEVSKGSGRTSKCKKIFCAALSTLLFALCSSTEAQQSTKVPRIGYLSSTSPSANSPRVKPFLEGLRELGYVEGKNIVIEWRYAEGNPDRVPALAAELVRLKVDIIVTAGPAGTGPAKAATVTVPIVMTQDDDPVANGFVASLARPGGNITGLSRLTPELSGKRLEVLKEIVPKLSRVSVGCLRHFNHCQQRKIVRRNGTCRGGDESPASIR